MNPGRDKNESPVPTDFVNLDQPSGSLMPGESLLAYLNTVQLGKGVPGNY